MKPKPKLLQAAVRLARACTADPRKPAHDLTIIANALAFVVAHEDWASLGPALKWARAYQKTRKGTRPAYGVKDRTALVRVLLNMATRDAFDDDSAFAYQAALIILQAPNVIGRARSSPRASIVSAIKSGLLALSAGPGDYEESRVRVVLRAHGWTTDQIRDALARARA